MKKILVAVVFLSIIATLLFSCNNKKKKQAVPEEPVVRTETLIISGPDVPATEEETESIKEFINKNEELITKYKHEIVFIDKINLNGSFTHGIKNKRSILKLEKLNSIIKDIRA